MTMLRVWPMVGRQEEQELVLAMMRGEPRRSAVLAGRAGVGKTRLATAVLDELAAGGYVVERLVGTRAASQIPLGTVGALVARHDPIPTEGAGLLQTMARVQRALHDQADGRPVVVGVDDAHCLDDASAAVIHQVVVAGIASVLLTVRTGEPGPDAVTAVWKDGLAELVELQPLPEHDLHDLLVAVLGGPVDEPTALELVRSCDGNCLFLRELVRTAIDDGSLELDRDLWRLRRPVAPGPRLTNLVEARLLDLPPTTRDVLELTAVGEPLPLEVLEGLVAPDALADAARHELIDTETDLRRSVVRLAHPLYGEVVRARLPWLGMRARCRTLADAFEATGLRRRDDVLRFVTWRLEAALSVDGKRLMEATELAQAGGDMAAVERFVSAAIESDTIPAEQQVNARVALAEAFNHRGRFRDSLVVLDAAEPTTEIQRVILAAWRANTLGLAGRHDEGIAHVTEVAATIDEPLGVTHLTLARVRLIAGKGRPAEALEVLYDEVIGSPEAEQAEIWVQAILAPALAFVGRFDEAYAIAAQGIDRHPGNMTGLRLGVEWADATLEMVAIGRGDINEAVALARRRLDTGLRLGSPSFRRAAAAAGGWALFVQGSVTEALPLLIEGVDDDWLDINGARSFAWAGLIGCYVLAGDLDQATETLRRAAAKPRPVRWFEPLMAVAEAMVAGRRGLPSEARQVLTRVLDETADAVNIQTGLYVAATATRVDAPDLAVAFLRPLVESGSVDGPLAALFLEHAEAHLQRDAAALGRVADRLEECGMVIMAIETLAAAANIEDAGNRSRAAADARTRARALGERCDGVDLSFLDHRAPTTGLTSRELEVARLAATGLSSADIATRLGLSVRTVDTHLGRVYLKLGVAGRAELRSVRELRVDPPT